MNSGMGSASTSQRGSGPTIGSAGGRLDPPHEKLVPIYPRDGVYVADNPAAILHGSWVSPIQSAAAADFVRFARTAQGQAVVRANGYRDIHGQTSAAVSHVALTIRNVHALSMPSAPTLSAVQASFPAVRKPARVLFLLDVSGSMGYEIRPGTSRLAAAKSAIAAALNYFNGTDRVGLAAFSNRPDLGIRPGIVSPIEPLSQGRQSFLAALKTLHPISETPLYRAVEKFTTEMAHTYQPDEINAIILLSDGHNHSQLGSSRPQMLHVLAAVHARVPILVFTLAYGHQADTATLAAIASATGAHYFNATNPNTVKEVLADELVTSF
jgi:Ca-activated chloride channel family protein